MFENLLKKIITDMTEDNEVEVRVGRITAELLEEWQTATAAHKAEHELIKEKAEAYLKTLTDAHSCDEYNAHKRDLWEKIYDEMGLTEKERGLRYTIDVTSRVISRIDEVDEKHSQTTKSVLS